MVLILTKYKFFLPGIVVIVVSMCYIVAPSSLVVYFVFAALMGLFLGAIYNSLENSEILNYTNNEPTKIDMFSTINIAVGTSVVGLSQFIIGLSLDLGSTDGSSAQIVKKGLIYVVIGGIAFIATTMALIRTCF